MEHDQFLFGVQDESGNTLASALVGRYDRIVNSFDDTWNMSLGGILLTQEHSPSNLNLYVHRSYVLIRISVNHSDTETEGSNYSDRTNIFSWESPIYSDAEEEGGTDTPGPNADEEASDENGEA
jgi:hypothetical protein